jgi:hypothetical protein
MPTWEEIVRSLESHIHEARIASSRMPVERDWNQVITCMWIIVEIEDLIQKSNPTRKWIYDPEPLAQRFQMGLKKLNEHWAMTLSQQMIQCLRVFPIP